MRVICIVQRARLLMYDFLNPLMPGGNKSSCVQKQTCSKLQVCLSTYDLLLPPGIKGLTSFLSVYVVMKFFLLSWIAALNTYVQVVVWHDHNCKSFYYQGSMSLNSSKAAPSFCSMVGQSLYDEPEHCLTWMPLWDSSWLSVTFLLFWKISFWYIHLWTGVPLIFLEWS